MSDSAPASSEREAQRWDAPAIDGSDGRGFLTAERLQELQKAAYDEAYQEGLRAGEKAGADAAKRRASRLDELLMALARPLDDLDEQVEKQLVELAMTVVKQLFRREIHIEPAHVIGVVREAIGLLPIASRDVRVLLHPDDASLVLETLAPMEGERAWTVVEDPLIARGGCKVVTDTSQIDAQSETRLQSIIASIVGDERSS